MARQNYGFQKRQKELAKQKKKEQKRLKKLERKGGPEDEPIEGEADTDSSEPDAADNTTATQD